MIYSLRKQAECDKLETRQTNQGKTDPNNVNNVNNKAKRAHQHMGGPEEVAEGVVEEVDEGGSVEVGVAHHLRGEERLSWAAAEETSHHAVAHVHIMGHFLRGREERKKGWMAKRVRVCVCLCVCALNVYVCVR